MSQDMNLDLSYRIQHGVPVGGRLALGLALFAVSMSATSASRITRTSAFEYDASGLINKEVVEPNDSDLCVVSTYTLDGVGNRTSASTRNCNGTSSEAAAPGVGSIAMFDGRTSSIGFSSDGRFPIKSTNALGQSESKTYDPLMGMLTSLTGPNGLTTLWAYDSLGRKILEKRADGNGTRFKYEYCAPLNSSGVTCAAVSAVMSGSTTVTPTYVITSIPVKAAVLTLNSDGSSQAGGDGGANGAYIKTYYDALGRALRLETQGFDAVGTAGVIYQDSAYDSVGRVLARSRPYAQGTSTTYWTTYTYDKLNRNLTETLPDGSKTTTTYQGLVTKVTNDLNQTLTESRNLAGQVQTVTDAYGKTLNKTYDAYGNLLKSTDSLGNVITLTYDIKGRKTSMLDPDMGSWSYTYNALGELKTQTDAKGQVSAMTYDLLGRLVQKAEPSLTSSWVYDRYQSDSSWRVSTCTKGIGKLCEAYSNNGYNRKNTFDIYGRPTDITSTIGGAYTASTTYDSDGRVDTLSYPSRNASNAPLLRVKNVYTTLGYLKQVVNADTPNNVYWRADAVDEHGRLTQQTTGNQITTQYGFDAKTGRLLNIKAGVSGSTTYAVEQIAYTYDTVGNLKTSSDVAVGSSEVYSYDNLNRLTNESRMGSAVTTPQSITWAYNEIGNISNRSDVGTYSYPVSGGQSVRPHAVSGVTGTVNGVTSPNYAYDANGNLTASTDRTVTWTSFNKVNTIKQTSGGVSNELAYVYNADGERVKETYTKNAALQRTTIYLNPAAGTGLFYEEETTPKGVIQKHYLNAAGGTFALLMFNKTSSAWTTEYWHTDNLGSTVAVTDQVGAVTERMAYEPFGKRRKVDGSTDLLGALAPAMTRRGFTGHEMIDEIGLVNMNGRIFDPAISRFLSADPTIQAANNLQNLNRYTYVLNSPTGGVDPSGYNWLSKTWHQVLPAVLPVQQVASTVQKAVMKVGFDVVSQMPGQQQIDKFIMGNEWAYQVGSIAAAYYGGPEGATLYSSYYTYKATGSISAGYNAGLTSYATALAFNAVGSALPAGTDGFANALGHAAVGCASAVASGGDCGQGAGGAFVGALGTNFGGSFGASLPGAMVFGGLGSVAAGGSFESGANIAAMGYLFNYLEHLNAPVNERAKNVIPLADDKIAANIDAFFDDVRALGIDLKLNDAFRTNGLQAMNTGNKYGGVGYNSSLHEAGFAFDVNWNDLSPSQQRSVLGVAAAHKFQWGGSFKPNDPVHFFVNPQGSRSSLIKNAQNEFVGGF